jgi:hypothetical protein
MITALAHVSMTPTEIATLTWVSKTSVHEQLNRGAVGYQYTDPATGLHVNVDNKMTSLPRDEPVISSEMLRAKIVIQNLTPAQAAKRLAFAKELTKKYQKAIRIGTGLCFPMKRTEAAPIWTRRSGCSQTRNAGTWRSGTARSRLGVHWSLHATCTTHHRARSNG